MKPFRHAAALALAASVALPATAQELIYITSLSGAAEVPPNASPATGSALVTFDVAARTMRVESSFSGLVGESTVAHIHCCTDTPGAGTAAPASPTPSFPGFPSGVTTGSYDQIFDMSSPASYSPAFLAASNDSAESAFVHLLTGVHAGTAYFNIHSSVYPNGEISGFLQPIPEPEAYAMMLAGLGLMGLAARRRRAH